jgi:hypothetical protein
MFLFPEVSAGSTVFIVVLQPQMAIAPARRQAPVREFGRLVFS